MHAQRRPIPTSPTAICQENISICSYVYVLPDRRCRGVLVQERSQSIRTILCSLVKLQLGAIFVQDKVQKSGRDYCVLHVLQMGPISAKCTTAIRHSRNIGFTWSHLRPGAQLCHNLAPTPMTLRLKPCCTCCVSVGPN